MTVRRARVGEILKLDRTPIEVAPDETYRRIGIYSWGKGILHREAVPGTEMGSLRYFRFPADSLMLSNIQAWESAVGVATAEDARDFVCSNRFLPYTEVVPGTVSTRYLLHYFLSEHGSAALKEASPGTQVRNRTLGKKLFEALEVPLPDPPEQRRIADHLDAVAKQATAATKSASAADTSLPPKALPQLISRALASAELPSVPLDELVQSVSDTIHPGDELRDAKDFIGLEHVESHTGRLLGARPVGDETGRKFRFESGDITYGYLRPYLNKAWLADRTGLCSVEQFVLRPTSELNTPLLAHVLRSSIVLDAAIAATNNLQLPRLKLGTLLSMTVPDIRAGTDSLLQRIDGLHSKFVSIEALRRARDEGLNGLLPAARNEIFNSVR